jgi:PAS domain S-box-containing protein
MNRSTDSEGPYKADGPRDADAFRRAEESHGTAHETSDLHRLLVDSVRDYAIFALDRTGHVLTWNTGAQRFKGWKAKEIIGTHFSIFYPPEDIARGKPDRALHEAVTHGSFEAEGWRVRKDGSRFWANVVITALRNESGELVGFAKVTRDLTDKRAADERLRESEGRFKLLVQSVRDYAIFMLDKEGRVATWNEGAERIKGYSAEEIVGRHFSVFYPAEVVASRFPQHELKVATSTGRFEDEGWRVRKDGSFFWASVIITALRDSRNRLVGFAKVTRDLTERRQAQERAIADARRVAEMEASNRTKSEFLATLSHELRTPLNAIGGYAELLDLEVSGSMNEKQRQYVERIRTSQGHLLALVNDLLNLARLEAGQVEFSLDAVRMADLLSDVHAIVQAQAESKGIDFEISNCPEAAVAWTDSSRAQQILLNLLSNAIKFTPGRGRVSIACSLTDTEVGINVIDTGPGIPEDKLEAIFEPFVQLGRSLTTTREGIGLGLAISRDLARGMSGDLKASSEVGEGSTFTLILPRVGGGSPAAGRSSEER